MQFVIVPENKLHLAITNLHFQQNWSGAKIELKKKWSLYWSDNGKLWTNATTTTKKTNQLFCHGSEIGDRGSNCFVSDHCVVALVCSQTLIKYSENSENLTKKEQIARAHTKTIEINHFRRIYLCIVAQRSKVTYFMHRLNYSKNISDERFDRICEQQLIWFNLIWCWRCCSLCGYYQHSVFHYFIIIILLFFAAFFSIQLKQCVMPPINEWCVREPQRHGDPKWTKYEYDVNFRFDQCFSERCF